MWNGPLLKFLDPALWMVGVTIGTLLAKKKGGFVPSEQVALVRPGGLGDLVLLTMAIEDMSLPLNFFRFFIESRSAPWAKHMGLDYIVMDRGLLKNLYRHRGKYTTVVNTEQYFGLSQAFARAICAQNGKTYGFSTLRAMRNLDYSVIYDPRDKHEIDEFTKLLKKATPTTTRPMKGHHRERQMPSEGYIALSVSGLNFMSRNFSEDRWLGIMKIHHTGSAPIKILAAPNECDFAQSLATTLRQRMAKKVDVVQGTFAETLKVLQHAEKLIGIEGGMTQLASYFGVPTIAIFTSSQDKKWAPLSMESSVIRRRDLPCQPCALFAQVPMCKNQYACKNTKHFIITELKWKNADGLETHKVQEP